VSPSAGAHSSQPPAPTPSTPPVIGGDLTDCLDSNELDLFLAPLVGPATLPARAFHDLRAGCVSAPALRTSIIHAAAHHPEGAIIPVHVRHHWTAAHIRATDDRESVTTVIYDSAPSPITRKDIVKMFSTLQLPAPAFRCIARQPYNSNECGLHVLLVALLHARTALPTDDAQPPPLLSLAPWRAVLQRLHAAPPTPDALTAELIDALPDFLPHTRPTVLLEPVTAGARPKRAHRRACPECGIVLPATDECPTCSELSRHPVPKPPRHSERVASRCSRQPHRKVDSIIQRPADAQNGQCAPAAEQAMRQPHRQPHTDAEYDAIRAAIFAPHISDATPAAAPPAPPRVDTTSPGEHSKHPENATSPADPAHTPTTSTVATVTRARPPFPMINIGNSCYMNASLQAINYVLESAFTPPMHAASELVRAITALSSPAADRGEADLRTVRRCLAAVNPTFALSTQEDSHEFLMTLLNLLDHTAQSTSTRSAPSFVHDHFGGTVELTTTCAHCRGQATSVDRFLAMSLPLPTDQRTTALIDLLASAATQDPFSARCDHCRKMTELSQRGRVTVWPQTLLIHLMRFDAQRFDDKAEKNQIPVTFPARLRPPGSDVEYQLTAVICHFGNKQSHGHYLSFVHRAGRWWRCDDGAISHAEVQDVLCERRSAYIPVFSRVDMPTPEPLSGPRFTTTSAPVVPAPAPAAASPAAITAPPAPIGSTKKRPIALRACPQCGMPLEGNVCHRCTHAPAAPQSDTAPPSLAQCCARDKVIGPWCAWHHPAIVAHTAQRQCVKPNSVGHRCAQRAIAACDATGATIFASAHCWTHMPEGERRRLTACLSPSANAPAAATSPTVAPDSASRPMPHTIVRDILVGTPVGTLMRLDVRDVQTLRRTVVLAVVTRAPAPRHHMGGAATPAELQVAAAHCARCDEWHTPLGSSIAVPSPEATYFAVCPANATDAAIAADVDALTPCCDNSECSSDADNDDVHVDLPRPPDPDLDPLLATVATSSGTQLRADECRSWHLFTGRPPHVHRATWAAVSEATRAEHLRWLRRVKEAPPDIAKMPLAKAVLELVLRMASVRKWSWPTISSKLSAARTSLKNLPLHSSSTAGIDIGADPAFQAAQALAQRKARVAALNPKNARPLTAHEFAALKRTAPHPLLCLCWFLAGRVGDVRRLDPARIEVRLDSRDRNDHVPVVATFTRGKGAFFWGPYAIHARVPLCDAKPIAEHIARQRAAAATDLFTETDQRHLSAAVGALPGASLRSIRKGSLQFFADAGAPDSALQLLSGHRHKDTLMRYLGFGVASSEARQAAQLRADLTAPVVGAGWDQQQAAPLPPGQHPRWAGPNSGFGARAGQRTPEAPELFPRKAYGRLALGLAANDVSTFPLKVKHVATLDFTRAAHLVADPQLLGALEHMLQFANDPALQNITWAPLAPQQLPRTTFSAEHWKQMLAVGKAIPLVVAGGQLQPLDGSPPFAIQSACRGFPTPQMAKRTLRPVFEPLSNATASRHFAPFAHRSRRETRTLLAPRRYRLQFDFASWFDQMAMSTAMAPYFICRAAPTEVQGRLVEYFALTRVPMGATWSSHLAQTVTWAILEPILQRTDVTVVTCIDNVCIAGDDAHTFAAAVQIFLQRCEAFGAQLNDIDTIPRDTATIIAAGSADREFLFLGEVYQGATVRNSEKNVEKVRDAYARLQAAIDAPPFVTRRQVASLIGTLTWTAHTLDIEIRDHYDALQLFGALGRDAPTPRAWDQAIPITARLVNALRSITGPIIANQPVIPAAYPHDRDATNVSSYDAVITVDASGTGAGAHIYFPHTGEMLECRKGWRAYNAHSAWAEPIAAREAVLLARSYGARRLAVITDHSALAHAQRRPITGNGGFSKAFYLNEFFRVLYADGQTNNVFWVDGLSNRADAPSRATMVGDTNWHIHSLRNRIAPELQHLLLPHSTPKEPNAWWCV
jgi:ubiquitin C-terminal hydrolase